MKAIKYIAIILGGLFLFAACKKELSFENQLPQGPASGTLKSASGNCQPVTIKGNYVKDSILTDSNYVVVQVNFSAIGKYKISTDTSNGFSFQDSGYALNPGLQSVRLKGTGKPVLLQQTIFLVAFDTSVCSFSINVTDSVAASPIVTPVTSADYFPTTDSSNWTYRLQSDTSSSDSIYTAVSPTDATIAGNTYRTFITTQSGTSDTSYYRKGGGLYYTYGNFNQYLVYDTVAGKADYIFLKDNVPVSSTWESPEVNATLTSITGKAKIRFTIEGKDISTTIGSTIDSVIQVKQEFMFAPAATGVYQTVVTANFYYAKNIGFIKAEISDPSPSVLYISRWKVYY